MSLPHATVLPLFARPCPPPPSPPLSSLQGLVEEYLLSEANRDNIFSHVLIWQLQVRA